MAQRLTKVAAATAAATALVAGGYAIGTRGDSSAAARSGGDRAAGPYGWRAHRDRGRVLETLAGKLGVTEAALRAALQDLRPQRRARRAEARDEHVTELADALGIGEVKVRAALDKLRAQRQTDRGGRAPSGAGHRDGPGARPDRAARISALADALGVKDADVRAAIDKFGRSRREAAQQRRGRGRP